MITLLQIFLTVRQWKFFKNRSIFDEGKDKISLERFLWPTVYIAAVPLKEHFKQSKSLLFILHLTTRCVQNVHGESAH